MKSVWRQDAFQQKDYDILVILSQAIKLMSITDLVSTLHTKDSVTFTLNSEFLNHNFEIVKQCLLKIKDIEANMGKEKENTSCIQKKISELQQKIDCNSGDINQNKQKIKEFSNNVGDDFMKKMYAIQQKTANMYDFDQTVRRIEELDKFLLVSTFKDSQDEFSREIDKVMKIKDELQRYVPRTELNEYKREQQALFEQKQQSIDKVNEQIQILEGKMKDFELIVNILSEDMKQNNRMIKQINFAEMLQNLQKQKDAIDHKLSEFTVKIKKKVGVNELLALEKSMIDKLDKFFLQSELHKAEKVQTKDALMFLQRKINELAQVIIKKLPDDDKDALFSSKKWQCASCTKDLGKFQGKLGQYKPWSIFPCKEPDPEKSGGFGYLNYVDKMAYKRGFDLQDQNLERLNKTFNDSKQTPRKMNSTRASYLISNYGSEERKSSLKDHYFREVTSERAERSLNTSKQFRVQKKQAAKQIIEEQNKSADAK